MTTKRKLEDVVLDELMLLKALRRTYGNWVTERKDIEAVLRTYIAEADLIPRPQTVEEWAEQMPVSVWENNTACAGVIVNEMLDAFTRGRCIATVPRPKPPRMTDEEIDKAAIDAAIRTYPCNERELTRSEEIAFYAGVALAERAKLEKERGNE